MSLRPCHAMSGTEIAYGAVQYAVLRKRSVLSAYARAMRCAVLCCYAVCGTEIAHAATLRSTELAYG
eukprot:352611-Rhodomonas_salina.1